LNQSIQDDDIYYYCNFDAGMRLNLFYKAHYDLTMAEKVILSDFENRYSVDECGICNKWEATV